jgi:hypothetical protein
MKISVIVPTMWMAQQFFEKMAPYILQSPYVGELIIIDNNIKNRPKWDELNHEKIKLYDFGENLFYNKSVNIGAKEAKEGILCLLNDDVIFDPEIFKVISYNLSNAAAKDIGMVYPNPRYFNRGEDNPELIKKLKFEVCRELIDGYGCAMFVKKENYIDIPEEFVHHFGDVWLHNIQIKNKRVNCWLDNWVVVTPMRVTTEKVPEVRPAILNDWKIANEIFLKHGIPIEDTSRDVPVFESGILPRYRYAK